jgi:hypothetical protein
MGLNFHSSNEFMKTSSFSYIYNINMLYYSNTDNIVQRKPWARGEPTSRCFSLQECSQFIKFCMGPIKWWHLSKRSDSDYISYLIDIYIYIICVCGGIYYIYIYTIDNKLYCIGYIHIHICNIIKQHRERPCSQASNG